MPLSLDQKEALFKAFRSAFKRQSEVQSDKTSYEKLLPFVTEMLLTGADAVVDALKSGGKLSPAQLGVFIVNRAAGFAGLSESDKVQCFGALLGVATSGVDLIGVIGAAGAAEVATGGLATPVVTTISIPMLISTGAAAALSAASVHQQCGPLVSKFFSDSQDELLAVFMQFNATIGNAAP